MSREIMFMDDEVAKAFIDLRTHIDGKFAQLPCTPNSVAIGKLEQRVANGKEQDSNKKDWLRIAISIEMAVMTIGLAVLALLTYLK